MARRLSHLLAALLLVGIAAAQQPAQPEPSRQRPRLGVLFWHDSPNDTAAFAGIRDGLAAAGITPEFFERSANADVHRAAQALGQLRAAECQLVFAMGTQAALLARRSITDRPLVYVAVANPVASGVVDAWHGSGSNVAGASYWIPPATVLRVFRLAIPELRRLGILRSLPSGIVSQAELVAMRDHQASADAPPIAVIEAVAADADDIPRAVESLRVAGVQAIWIPNDFTIYRNLELVHRGLRGARLPLVTTAQNAARTDAVVGATVDLGLHGRRAAALAVRILGGADPGTLPVDTMQSFLVLANVDAARRCGCELPLSLLAVADELIASPSPSKRHDDHR